MATVGSTAYWDVYVNQIAADRAQKYTTTEVLRRERYKALQRVLPPHQCVMKPLRISVMAKAVAWHW